MKNFFKSARFKALVAVLFVLILIMIVAGNLGGWASPQSSVAGAVATPVQQGASGFSNALNDFFSVFSRNKELAAEVEDLKEQVNSYREMLIDYQTTQEENEEYKKYLEIKTENPDFKFEPASVIARDPLDDFGSFTIDKGTLRGISANDPVITSEGLVGYVSEAAPTYCKVVTVLNPKFNAGALDRRTGEAGIVSGSLKAAENGLCEFSLNRSSAATENDMAVTLGGEKYPKNLLIGHVFDVRQGDSETSVIALVKPAADIFNLRSVMVITSFDGKSPE